MGAWSTAFDILLFNSQSASLPLSSLRDVGRSFTYFSTPLTIPTWEQQATTTRNQDVHSHQPMTLWQAMHTQPRQPNVGVVNPLWGGKHHDHDPLAAMLTPPQGHKPHNVKHPQMRTPWAPRRQDQPKFMYHGDDANPTPTLLRHSSGKVTNSTTVQTTSTPPSQPQNTETREHKDELHNTKTITTPMLRILRWYSHPIQVRNGPGLQPSTPSLLWFRRDPLIYPSAAPPSFHCDSVLFTLSSHSFFVYEINIFGHNYGGHSSWIGISWWIIMQNVANGAHYVI